MEMLSKWRAVPNGDFWIVETQNGDFIAATGKGKDAKANAHLIATNPYIFEALEGIVSLIGDDDLPDNGELSGAAICDMVRAAIQMVHNVE
jgi:hypothetical protein